LRDNFPAKTIRTLAARVGNHCSNPICVSSTLGPALNEDKTVSIGVAAHIAAAALGGKRYDVGMTPAERSSAGNGIWLCQSCSKLIDSDENRYTVDVLHQWKKDAIQRAFDAIASGRPLGQIKAPSMLDAADEDFLGGLDLPSSDAVEAVAARLRTASATDIVAFRAERDRPFRTLALTLRLRESNAPNLTLDGLARLMVLSEPASIVAPGGTGKSTTIVQLAERILADNCQVAALVPLGEWSDRQDDFFNFLLRRNAFGVFRRQHFMQLAYHGKLVLLLDGWNELPPDARLRATRDLKALQREYPQLGFVISTRPQALPVAGHVVEIEPLSHDQQIELARAVRGEQGIDLVDRAWRDARVRELVGIPLYLNALLTLPPGTDFPETKEAVLCMFVRQNESAADKIEILERDTLGQHTAMLQGLAVDANRAANTVISDSRANRSISRILRRLSEDGQIQIGAAPQPRTIVDGLVRAHLLVRAAATEGSIAFQHQLFQEWYAAGEVEQLMMQSANGDSESRKRLREEILNWPSWEESILFACDRLSRAGEASERAVAVTVEDTLCIDPVLAAAMLDRATEGVWSRVRPRILRFVDRWHTPGAVDRAVRFMVTSGKSEFADHIWPLVSNTDPDIQFETIRASDHFRLAVLGADYEARLQALPVDQRRRALSEIASVGDLDGTELAARIAVEDPDPSVVASVVEMLDFRRDNRRVTRVMRAASDAVWKAIVDEGSPEHFADPQLNERLVAERLARLATEGNPYVLLCELADLKPSDAEARITAVLGSGNVTSNLEIARAHAVFPSAVVAGLMSRIEAGLPMPFGFNAFLKDVDPVDSGPVAEVALDPSTSERRLNEAAAVIGPGTVSVLFDQFFAIDDRLQASGINDERLRSASSRLRKAIGATRLDVFVEVLAARARTDNPHHIGLMADLFARHGSGAGDRMPPIAAVHGAMLRTIIDGWIKTLLAAPHPVRYASSEVASAAERLADATLAEPLRRLLERDLIDYAAAQASYRPGQVAMDIGGYSPVYARAFAAMHDASAVAVLTRDLSDLRWGTYAAGALYEIWAADHLPEDKRIVGWTNFAKHLIRRAERADGTPPTSVFAEAIFDVVRELGDATKPNAEQQHAVALAVPGLGLPHGAKRREIDVLLALPLPIAHKNRLLSAAARAGEVIPATFLIEGVCDLLEGARTERWRLDENSGELAGWIYLFPFSDDPAKVHEALALVPHWPRQSHAIRRLLETLPQGPADSALARLERLAADNPAFLQDFGWIDALIKLDTESAARTLLDRLCAGQILGRNVFQLSHALAAWALKYPNIRMAMIARYRTLPAGDVRAVIETAFEDLTDEDVFMAMFDAHVDDPDARNIVLTAKRLLWSGAFDELPLIRLRAHLFAMLRADDKRAQLAKQCLIVIEEQRDEKGRVNDEPRHPDISTGRAWPPEAEEQLLQ
jgi:hypothetical protein